MKIVDNWLYWLSSVKMKSFPSLFCYYHKLCRLGKKSQQFLSSCSLKLTCFVRTLCHLIVCFCRFVPRRFYNSFWIQLCYFISLSFFGFWVLKFLKPRTDSFKPTDLDLFFTSVSATTVSSMSTVEMEVFSNSQLIVLTVLMFVGGEVFTSMVGLFLRKAKVRLWKIEEKIASVLSSGSSSSSTQTNYNIDLVVATAPDKDNLESGHVVEYYTQRMESLESSDDEHLIQNSLMFLGFVVSGFLVVVHVVGVSLVLLYTSTVSSARDVLNNKRLRLFTFSLFTTVSTFASCGFVPTNENMMVFSRNSGLLLILIPQVLLGNTLYPPCLRFTIWVVGKFTKKEESNYLLKNSAEIGYQHLLPSLHSSLLVFTVFGFIVIQLVLFCSMEWNSDSLNGLNSYQKIIGGVFQSVNSRHTGETIVDISTITPAILVLFVVMMYLPPYASFLPVKDEPENPLISEKKKRRRRKVVENVMLSQLSYLAIFILLICISERKKMKEDPLNFNLLSIVVEVTSAYGNVGFTTGYSCRRQLTPDGSCEDKWYGFVGRWSDQGKLILIIVMFFGRLKRFSRNGGRAWKLW